MFFRTKTEMVSEADALAGRTDRSIAIPDTHTVLGHPLTGPWPDGIATAVFGLGCFWGAEKLFWQCRASTRPLPATPVGTPRTRPTKRCAPAVPATPKWCSWRTTRRR